MSDVTRILNQISEGDPSAADQLLPIVYQELRKLAAIKLANEKPGNTLQATALVHEAYLRLVDGNSATDWDSRGHFFGAAAEAMRRILVDRYRQKATLKRGGDRERLNMEDVDFASVDKGLDLLELDDALQLLESKDEEAAAIAKLRIFAGFSVDDAGQALGIPHTSAYRQWAYAQAWLQSRIGADE